MKEKDIASPAPPQEWGCKECDDYRCHTCNRNLTEDLAANDAEIKELRAEIERLRRG